MSRRLILAQVLSNSSDSPSSGLITFTIDGVEYQAEQGMTWAVWCESSYNTDGFIYAWGDANRVIYVSGYKRYVNIGTSADPSTVEITNTSYTTKAVNWPR